MKLSKIQWCHGTINPVMGCGGCELWPNISRIIGALIALILRSTKPTKQIAKREVTKQFQTLSDTTAAWHARHEIIQDLGRKFPGIRSQKWIDSFEKLFRCYAGILHLIRGAKPDDFSRATNKGYAPIFDDPQKFPGRMAEAANWEPPTENECRDKPWLNGLPRLVFVSDMGDALSASIDFDYLKTEIIDNVSSPKGQRHIWLWLTKRPKRMAEFATWLKEVHELSWPDNLVAMTSVTNRATRSRIDHLRQVPAATRGLSVEPLTESVELNLEGIDWVIAGGESGKYGREFDLAWARSIHAQCQDADVAFFMKQAGANVVEDGFPITLTDGHGGNWNEWPADLRVREFPSAFSKKLPTAPESASTVSNQNNPQKN